jgi:hypothetical protein
VTRRKFTKEQLKDMDVRAYLASDDSQDEDEDYDNFISERGDDDGDDEFIDKREKYKRLLLGGAIDADPYGKKGDVDMEITFTPGLSDAASERLKEMQERKVF